MEAFDGIFTKRGESTVYECPTSGAFEDVFVRRGRWRKSSSEIIQPAEDLVPKLATAEYPMPTMSDATSPDEPVKIDIKNTFVNASMLDFDSLKDFLKERKVQSCPTSRQASGVTMLFEDIVGKEDFNEILNTASSFGDIPAMIAAEKDATQYIDDVESIPSGSTASELALNEEVFNTASTYTDSDFECLQQRNCDVGQEANQDDLPYETRAGDDMLEEVAAEDKLSLLRMRGSAIQQTIGQSTHNENQAASGVGFGARSQQPSNQFLVSVQTPDGILPGIVTLLGGSQQEQQMQCPTILPNQPPLITAAAVPGMSMPTHPPPVAPPVLRLADAIATPEVGGPELPSIGSLLHHKGECKPCTFFHTRGCENKENCKFCHLCAPNEKKRRLKALKAVQREATFAALEQAKATLAFYQAAEEQGFQVDTIIE